MAEDKPAHKKFFVDAEFPELPGGKMYQTWRGEATSIRKAPFEALKDIMARDGIKGRRIHQIKLRVVEIIEPRSE